MLLTHHRTGALPPSAHDTGDRKPFSTDNFAGFLHSLVTPEVCQRK